MSSSKLWALLWKLLNSFFHIEFMLTINGCNNSFSEKLHLSGDHLREKFLITAGYQSLTFPHSLVARIRSNVYNKPNHIAQTEPVFLRLAFMTFYPTLEINQASRNPAVVCFFIHPLEAETIFTTAPQQKQTWDIIKEITILPNSRERNTQTNTSSLFCFIFRKKEAEVCGHWHLHEEICAVTVCKGGKKRLYASPAKQGSK